MRYDDAINAFKEALKLHPDDPQSTLMIGVNLLHLNRAADAIPFLEQAAKLDPEALDSFVHRIEAHGH